MICFASVTRTIMLSRLLSVSCLSCIPICDEYNPGGINNYGGYSPGYDNKMDCYRCPKLDPAVDCTTGELVREPCGCMECAKDEGERCGGPWGISGTCASHLICQTGSGYARDGVCRETRGGICDQEFGVSGQCLGYNPMFSYNKAQGKCQEFFYGGCGGNYNKFDTLAQCQSKCEENTGTATCPSAEPAVGDPCPGPMSCSYGEECCCGQCHSEKIMECREGRWQGYFTDACLGGC